MIEDFKSNKVKNRTLRQRIKDKLQVILHPALLRLSSHQTAGRARPGQGSESWTHDMSVMSSRVKTSQQQG